MIGEGRRKSRRGKERESVKVKFFYIKIYLICFRIEKKIKKLKK